MRSHPKDAGTIKDVSQARLWTIVTGWIRSDTVEPDKLHDGFFAVGTGAGSALAVMNTLKLSERQVRLLATGEIAVLRANPALVAYLLGK